VQIQQIAFRDGFASEKILERERARATFTASLIAPGVPKQKAWVDQHFLLLKFPSCLGTTDGDDSSPRKSESFLEVLREGKSSKEMLDASKAKTFNQFKPFVDPATLMKLVSKKPTNEFFSSILQLARGCQWNEFGTFSYSKSVVILFGVDIDRKKISE
jgi:hypothetical protein